MTMMTFPLGCQAGVQMSLENAVNLAGRVVAGLQRGNMAGVTRALMESGIPRSLHVEVVQQVAVGYYFQHAFAPLARTDASRLGPPIFQDRVRAFEAFAGVHRPSDPGDAGRTLRRQAYWSMSSVLRNMPDDIFLRRAEERVENLDLLVRDMRRTIRRTFGSDAIPQVDYSDPRDASDVPLQVSAEVKAMSDLLAERGHPELAERLERSHLQHLAMLSLAKKCRRDGVSLDL